MSPPSFSSLPLSSLRPPFLIPHSFSLFPCPPSSLIPLPSALSTSSSENEEEDVLTSKDTSLKKKRSQRGKKKDRKEKMKCLEQKMSRIQCKLQKLALEQDTESQQDVEMSGKVV